MNKKLVNLVFGIIILLGVINTIFALDGYCFMRVGNGQSVPTTIISTTKHMTCDGTRCTVHGLMYDSSFLQICTDSKGYYSTYTNCEKLCNTGPSGVVANLTLNAVFPFEDGGVFTKQTFFLDVTTNKIASISLIDNIKGTVINLCPNCASYKKAKTFTQGKNDITIRAVRDNEVLYKSITFFIDNIKPLISKTTPFTGKFSDGSFYVYYSEANVVKTTLYYGDLADPEIVESIVCPSGKSQSCVLGADLSDYNGRDIYYWFEIKDVAGIVTKSRPIKVSVDNTPPSMNSFEFNASKTGVSFKIGITERNFDKVYYYDNGDIKGKILCSSLSKGMCLKKLVFRPGAHEVNVVVKDKAGNSVSQLINFEI